MAYGLAKSATAAQFFAVVLAMAGPAIARQDGGMPQMPRGTGDEGGLPAMGDANGTIAQDMATGGTAAMDGLDAVTATAAGPRIPEDMGGAGTPTDMGGAGTPTNVNVMYGMDDVPPEMGGMATTGDLTSPTMVPPPVQSGPSKTAGSVSQSSRPVDTLRRDRSPQ